MEVLPEKTYFETHADMLLKEAGLNKARFSEQMGIARQNVQKVFSSKNIFTLIKAAEILDKSLDTLIYGTTTQQAIDGFVEVNGTVFRVKSKKDIEDLLEKI